MVVKILDLARGGAGVARDETGRVIFVPFTAPGDVVRIEILDEEKRYAQGRLLEVLEPSPQRVKPPCPVFGRCGGCQWQHLPYELQWKTKVGGIRHALERVQAPAPPGAFDELPAERIWEYRNRIQLRGQGRQLGFYAAGSHDLVPIERCEIARPELNAIVPALREEAKRFHRPYKVEVDVLPDGTIRKAWNAKHAALGFRQVHDEQNEKLRSWVTAQLGPLNEGQLLLDLFGGSGNLSLGLASQVREIHCVDVGVPRPKPEGTPANYTFHRSEVAPWITRWSQPTDLAIMDPPREGLGAKAAEIASALERLKVKRLAAVGCDADAWARDVARLVRRGWRLERVGVLDLFPQTPHVEALALLTFAS